MATYSVHIPKFGSVSGVDAFSNLEAILASKKLLGVESNVAVLGARARVIQFKVGDKRPPLLVSRLR